MNFRHFCHTFLTAALLTTSQSQAATLYYSNDGMGDIEPCGCRSNPQGGLVRKARMIEKEGDSSFLQLDAGNFLFPTLEIPEGLKEQYIIQSHYLLKALELLHQDVIVPGEKDFSLGVAEFKKATLKSSIHFLAANLKDSKGRIRFETSHIFNLKKKDGKTLKVAVIGLVGRDLPYPKEFRISDPIAEAKKRVPGLKKKADLVIVVSHQGLEKDKALAEAVKDIDSIFGGYTQSFLQKPVQVAKTLIYQSSFRNQYIGEVKLDLERPMPEFHQLIGLDANYEPPTNPSEEEKKLISVRMATLVTEFKAAVAKLNTQSSDAAEKLAESAVARAPQGPKFQTFPKCSECHLKQYDFWRKTPHAMALTPLLINKQLRNKECLTCHTVGAQDKEGYTELSEIAETQLGDENKKLELEQLEAYLKTTHDAKSLSETVILPGLSSEPVLIRHSISRLHHSYAPVQCENCHTPGNDHPFGIHKMPHEVSTNACVKCHTPERAPDWYKDGKLNQDLLKKKLQLMTCPKGELEEEK